MFGTVCQGTWLLNETPCHGQRPNFPRPLNRRIPSKSAILLEAVAECPPSRCLSQTCALHSFRTCLGCRLARLLAPMPFLAREKLPTLRPILPISPFFWSHRWRQNCSGSECPKRRRFGPSLAAVLMAPVHSRKSRSAIRARGPYEAFALARVILHSR